MVETVSNSPNRMTTRLCPLCNSEARHVFLTLEARQFCQSNYTYRKDFEKILGIKETDNFPIAKCDSCGFVYAQFLPSQDFLSAVYGEVIDPDIGYLESTNHRWVAHQLQLASLLLEELGGIFGPREKLRLLDFGCGYGTLVRALFGERIDCFGFETGEREKEFLAESNLPFLDSIEGLNRNSPFHGIFLSDVLEHVSSPRQTLELCHGLLADNGLICANVPNFSDDMWKDQFKLLRNGGGYTRGINPWEHLNYFSPESFAQMVSSSGFRLIEPGGPIDIGLRFHQESAIRRWGNLGKSILRLVRSGLTRSSPPNTFCLAQRRSEERKN